jgi:hypothetical protein
MAPGRTDLLAPLALVLAGLAGGGGCATAEPCPQPLQECGGTCVDVSSDVHHCGACNLACTGGLACVSGRCAVDQDVGCTTRGGGAFVTFAVCGAAVKVWVTNATFVAEAQAILDGAAPPHGPMLDLLAGPDCDDQWSFHPDPATARFAGSAGATCDACPDTVQHEIAYFLFTVGQWCPSTADVVAVDRRP